MKKLLAVPMVAAVVLIPTAALGQQESTTPTPAPAAPSCVSVKKVYSEKHWREAKPQRGHRVCPSRRSSRRSTIGHFYDYRHYRQIATMKCEPGSEGYFVPNPGSCSTLECESGLSWRAYNPSGAEGAYQLLGHGQPWPIHGFHDRLIHHEIAATLGRSSWVCAG